MKLAGDAIALTGTDGPWIVETHPTSYPDLFTYDIIAPHGWSDPETGRVRACAVATGLDSAADARLIAAAPELLRTLLQVRDSLRGALGVAPETFKYEIGWINAAIVAARGRI